MANFRTCQGGGAIPNPNVNYEGWAAVQLGCSSNNYENIF